MIIFQAPVGLSPVMTLSSTQCRTVLINKVTNCYFSGACRYESGYGLVQRAVSDSLTDKVTDDCSFELGLTLFDLSLTAVFLFYSFLCPAVSQKG